MYQLCFLGSILAEKGKEILVTTLSHTLGSRAQNGKLSDLPSHSIERAALRSTYYIALHALEVWEFACYYWTIGIICYCSI